jgi:hypothetical protein
LRVAFGGRPLPRRNSSSVAFAPISPGSTSAAGRALAISFRVHSGLSASGREGLGFRVLLIQFFLFPVSFPEADNTKFILSRGDNDCVQPAMRESKNTQAKFTIVVAGILHDECGFPIEFRGKRKGQPALGYVLLVFGSVEGKTHPIYCYSDNYTLSRMEVGGVARHSSGCSTNS